MRKAASIAVHAGAHSGESVSAKNARVARTRRQRGYNWEDTLVKRFGDADGWSAVRLGSPSTSLPDVIAVSTLANALYAIEAKSGTTASLPVPAKQIERCVRWARMFGRYENARIVLAFKFLSKRRIGASVYEGRQLREYYKEWDPSVPAQECVCTYEGKTFVRCGDARTPIGLADCKMPFGSPGA